MNVDLTAGPLLLKDFERLTSEVTVSEVRGGHLALFESISDFLPLQVTHSEFDEFDSAPWPSLDQSDQYAGRLLSRRLARFEQPQDVAEEMLDLDDAREVPGSDFENGNPVGQFIHGAVAHWRHARRLKLDKSLDGDIRGATRPPTSTRPLGLPAVRQRKLIASRYYELPVEP